MSTAVEQFAACVAGDRLPEPAAFRAAGQAVMAIENGLRFIRVTANPGQGDYLSPVGQLLFFQRWTTKQGKLSKSAMIRAPHLCMVLLAGGQAEANHHQNLVHSLRAIAANADGGNSDQGPHRDEEVMVEEDSREATAIPRGMSDPDRSLFCSLTKAASRSRKEEVALVQWLSCRVETLVERSWINIHSVATALHRRKVLRYEEVQDILDENVKRVVAMGASPE